MTIEWTNLLLAYLHDPPDKALSIRGHVPRARDNAQIAVGNHVSREVLEEAVSSVDPLASLIERFPMLTAGIDGERAVGPQDGKLQVVHPLSNSKEWETLSVPPLNDELSNCQKKQLERIIADVAGSDAEQARNRFLAIWRLWPDALTHHCHPCFARLPADTRTPDHTVWNHLDVTAAFKAAESAGGGAGLLAFALGPVQQFIEAARSVRDLWSGSMILSWLSFRAMLPIIEQLGPTALIYPALRGNPLLDIWLREPQRVGVKLSKPDLELRKTPALPHRFLALVPWGNDGEAAKNLATLCQKAVAVAWQKMAKAVHDDVRIYGKMTEHCSNWDKRWDSQIGDYFNTATVVLPLSGAGDEIDRQLAKLLTGKASFHEAFSNAESIRELARSIPKADRPDYAQDHAGRWQYQVELVQRMLAAQRSVRHVPLNPPVCNNSVRWPHKCTLLGSFEQMGPDDLQQSKNFWDQLATLHSGLSVDGVRIRQGEALCAVALVKRFAGPAFLREQLRLSVDDLRFPDTWTVAAAEWLHGSGIAWTNDWFDDKGKRIPWNGHWLHWSRINENAGDDEECPQELWNRIQDAKKQHGAPPVYYAILKLDGDDLGDWLRGDKSPLVREVMHPTLVSYYERLGQPAKAGLDAKRPVGPALHASISTALANFALHVVPDVVKAHHGTVIYSGGDDTLVLLPVSKALACARELQKAYTSNYYTKDGREYLMMGSRATISGGLVIVHAKDDLRLALQDARAAEEHAKKTGKDALVITVRRRSGEHTAAVCPWSFTETVEQWRQAFASGASDRWMYHLHAIRTTLELLPVEAIKAEMCRRLRRTEQDTPSLIPPDRLAEALDHFYEATIEGDQTARLRIESTSVALRQFLTLCQSASFMARGRDA